MATELATAYISLIPSAKGLAAGIGAELGAPLEAAAVTSGASASKGFAGAFSGGLGGLKSIISKALPVAALAVAGGAALKLGENFHDAYNTIRVDTGQTGDALNGLEADFRSVLAIRPDSFDAVSTAISKLNVGLGLTGAPLQDLAAQVLRLSAITKTDLGANLDAVTTLMNNFGVSAAEQGGRLDELFRASQATGVSVADLASSMASGGAVLRTVGLDFEQSAALLGLLGKVGVEATSVLQPLSRAIATAAKDGKSAQDVFTGVFDAIRNAPNDTAAAGAAIDVFGAKAGPKLAGLIREGKLSYQDLADTIANGSDTIAKAASDTATFSSKFKIFKNSLAVAFEPIAIRSVEAATAAMVKLTKPLGTFAAFVATATDKVAKFFDLHPSAAFAILAGTLGTLLLPVLGSVVTKLGFFLNPTTLVIAALVALTAVIVKAYQAGGPFTNFVDILISDFEAVIDAFKEGDTFGFSTSDGLIGSLLVMGATARTVFDNVTTFVGGLVDAIAGIDFDDVFVSLETHFGNISKLAAEQKDIIVPLAAGFATFAGTLVAVNKGQSALTSLGSASKVVGPVLSQAIAPLLSAGPIGLAVAAVLAVAAAFAAAYFKIKPFRDAVDGVASTVRDLAVEGFARFQRGVDKFTAGLSKVGDFFKKVGAGAQAGVAAVVTALTPLATFIRDNVISTIAAAVDFVQAVLERVGDFLGPAVRNLTQAVGTIASVIGALIGPAVAILKSSFAIIVDIFQGFAAVAVPILQIAFDAIVAVVTIAFTFVTDFIEGALAIIRGVFEVGAGILRGDWSAIWDGIQDIVVVPMQAASDFVSTTLDTIVGFFAGMPSRLADAAVGMWDFLKDTFKDVLDGVIDLWNSLSIPSFTIGGWDTPFGEIPGWDTPEIHFPQIPRLALGGIVMPQSGGSIVNVAEAGKPEVVAPIDTLAGLLKPFLGDVPSSSATGRGGVTIEQHVHSNGLTPEETLDLANRKLGWQLSGLAVSG